MIDGIRNDENAEVGHSFRYVERICKQKEHRKTSGPHKYMLGLRLIFLYQKLYEIDKGKRKREQCDKMVQHKIATWSFLLNCYSDNNSKWERKTRSCNVRESSESYSSFWLAAAFAASRAAMRCACSAACCAS